MEQTLLAAYKQQRGETEVDLSQLSRVSNANRKISDAQLITWIQKWQKLNKSS